MKIQSLIENEIQPSRLPANEHWYHCGPKFDKFSTAFLGGGENNHLLGFGMYFINRPEIAKGYAKYVKSGVPVLYEVKLNAASDDFYCSRNRPSEKHVEGMNKIANMLGYETYQAVKYRHSAMTYGRGLVGAVFEQFGAQKGAQILIDAGILGQFEDIGDGVFEIAVWDTSIIQVVNKVEMEPNPDQPKQEPDPDLDAWWEEFMRTGENPDLK